MSKDAGAGAGVNKEKTVALDEGDIKLLQTYVRHGPRRAN